MVVTAKPDGARADPEGKDVLWERYCVKMHSSLAASDHFCVAGHRLADTSADTSWRGRRGANGGGRNANEHTATRSEKRWTYCKQEASQPSLRYALRDFKPQTGFALRPAS